MYTLDPKTRQKVVVEKDGRARTMSAIAAFYNEPHPTTNLEQFIKRLEAGQVLKKRGVTIQLEKKHEH